MAVERDAEVCFALLGLRYSGGEPVGSALSCSKAFVDD